MEKNGLYPSLAPSAPPPNNDYQSNNNPPPYFPGPQAQSSYQQPQQQQQQPAQAIIINHQISSQFGPYPTKIICPFCNVETITKTAPKVGTLTYLLSGSLAILCACCLCCLIPCCFDRCKDVEHRCKSCGKPVGLYKRL